MKAKARSKGPSLNLLSKKQTSALDTWRITTGIGYAVRTIANMGHSHLTQAALEAAEIRAPDLMEAIVEGSTKKATPQIGVMESSAIRLQAAFSEERRKRAMG